MEVSESWKIIQFPKVSWSFTNRLTKIVQLPPPHQTKTSYVPRTKIFYRRYTRICRVLLSKCYGNAVLRRLEHCTKKIKIPSDLVTFTEEILNVNSNFVFCAVEMVQTKYFFDPNQNMGGGKFAKWVAFLTIFLFFKFFYWRFFERNWIVKSVIFFASFCWLWDFLLENLKLKYEVLNHLFSSPNFIFRTVLGCFSQCNFKFFHRRPTMATDIFTQVPVQRRKASYGPNILLEQLLKYIISELFWLSWNTWNRCIPKYQYVWKLMNLDKRSADGKWNLFTVHTDY